MIAITQVRDNKCLIQDSSGEAADNCTCLEAESTIQPLTGGRVGRVGEVRDNAHISE